MFIGLSLVLLLSILGANGNNNPAAAHVDVCVSMDYDDVTTEVFDGQTEETIGWIKILGCNEGQQSSSSRINYLNEYIDELLPLAYTFRITPPNGKSNPQYDDLAVILKPGSTLMNELNTGERPESSSSSDWIGSSQALARVTMPHPRNPYSKFGKNGYYHWANGNGGGIHVTDNSGSGNNCAWDWNDILRQDIEMYLGFRNFDDITTEVFDGVSESIGWIKLLGCNEGQSSASRINYLNPNIDSLLSNAYTFRMIPPNGKSNPKYDEFAVVLKPGSTLMSELNNSERPESSSNNDWIGSSQALTRVTMPNPRNPYTKFGGYHSFYQNHYYFWANGNGAGIHVTDNNCYWDWRDTFGENIEMYVGYQNIEGFDAPLNSLNNWKGNMFEFEQYPYFIKYLAFGLIILLILNIVCITMNIRNKSNKRLSKKYKYNKVVNESEYSE